jgi:PDZ domain-containing protein
MTRRTLSLLAAGAVLAALLAVSFLVPMPYVVMSPGLTENTLGSYDGTPVIEIKGHKTYPTSGHLDLTTVSVTSPDFSPRLNEVLSAWWSKDEIVLPRDVAYPPNQSVQQVETQNRQDMDSSQKSAIAAGLAEAGVDHVTSVTIDKIEKGAPADGVLEKGDVVAAVDGTAIGSIADLVANVSKVEPGDSVTLDIRRDGNPRQLTLKTEASPDDPTKSRIGVVLGEQVDPPFKVHITLGADIGGPSAGMMFALAIYDRLTPGELTGGRFVAGTGTITTDGTVGEIGGVQQKIAGAYQQGATVFLVPAGDCDEAAQSPLADDIQLINVAQLDDAVHALEGLESGDESAYETCSSG